jgi:Tfp pilus assembly protein PilV
MVKTGGNRRASPMGGTAGFSLLEVMVAATLILVIFYGVGRFYVGGRRQLDYEEDRRKATAVIQARLDGIRRDYTFETLPSLDGTSKTYTVRDSLYAKTYILSHSVSHWWDSHPTANATQADTLTLTATWTAKVGNGTVNRSASTTTVLARGMP